MRAGWRRSVELVPEFRGLIAHVPAAFEAARREHALLGAGGFLVAADAGDQSVEAVFGQRPLQPFGLARRGARGRRQGRVDGVDRRAGLDLEIELPLFAVAGRGTHTSPEISCRCRRAAPGTARGRRTPCAPARSSRWSLCRATTAAPASSAARTLRAGCRCSAPRVRRGGPSRAAAAVRRPKFAARKMPVGGPGRATGLKRIRC